MNEILQKVYAAGIVPVIKIDDAKKAVPLAKAILAGGLNAIEITFRTAAAEEAIRNIAAGVPEMLIGAGTLTTVDQLERAIKAGAKFGVSPGLNPVTVKACQERGFPILPGCANPSDIEMALSLGLEVVKFFPAENVGGLPMIKALAAPYTNMKFVPTGGISEKNAVDYFKFDKVWAVGGSWMAPADLIDAEKWDVITAKTREAINLMLGFEVAHVGMNMPDAQSASELGNELNGLLGLPIKDGNSSVFIGKGFELMKSPYLGANGHIAIKTNNLRRAIAHLEARGVELDHSTVKESGGKMVAIYFKGEYGGFALHLVQG